MKKIFIAETEDISRDVINELKKYFNVTFKNAQKNELKNIFENFHVFWFRLGFKIDSAILKNPKNIVETIVCPVTGLDHIDVNLCKKKGIKIISLRGEKSFLKKVRATSELTILLALELLRNARFAFDDVHKGKWVRNDFKGHELYNKKIAILGYGRLGKIVADLFSAFGAIPVVYDIKKVKSKYEVANSLKNLLMNAYLCSIHISYSEENIDFFNEDLIKLLPKGCFIVNTSRGSLVCEKDVVKYLINNHISAYATDVLSAEPDIKKSKLWKYARYNPERVIITPHIGGNTYESFKKTEKFMFKKLIEHYGL